MGIARHRWSDLFDCAFGWQVTFTKGPYILGSLRFVDLPVSGTTKQATSMTLTFSDGSTQSFAMPAPQKWWDFTLVPVVSTSVTVCGCVAVCVYVCVHDYDK